MKKVVEKDKLKRYLFKKYEQKRLALKVLQRLPAMLEVTSSNEPTSNMSAQSEAYNSIPTKSGLLTRYAGLALARLPRNSAKSRIRNRCVLTGRGNGVYRAFRISRIELRQCASLGHLPYVKKASW
jgi:ribosomal protein S14